jgi:hypothetical protein
MKDINSLYTVSITTVPYEWNGPFVKQFNQATFFNFDTNPIAINELPIPGGGSFTVSLNAGEININSQFRITSTSNTKNVWIVYTEYTQYTNLQ